MKSKHKETKCKTWIDCNFEFSLKKKVWTLSFSVNKWLISLAVRNSTMIPNFIFFSILSMREERDTR